jgi:hypothetical protein
MERKKAKRIAQVKKLRMQLRKESLNSPNKTGRNKKSNLNEKKE